MAGRPDPAADLDALRELARHLAAVLRTAEVHSADAPVFAEPVEQLRVRATRLVQRYGSLTVTTPGGVRVNGVALQFDDPDRLPEPDLLTPLLARRRFEGVEFKRPPPPAELKHFLEVWRAWRPGGRGPEAVNQELRKAGVRTIRFVVPSAEASADLSTGDEELAAYCALLAVSEALGLPGIADDPAEGRKREAALEAVGIAVAASAASMLPLTTYRDATRYEAVHTANTTVLSMLLARRLGLGYEAILDVGRGALHADVGMTEMRHARDFRGALDHHVTRQVIQHPVASFLSALRSGELDAGGRARAIVAYEHHQGLSGRGYPGPPTPAGPHLFSRIVSIADAYDALVHDRGDRDGLARPMALEALEQLSGDRYDPRLLRTFFAMLGRYPPGSIVRLSNGEIAIVARPSLDPRMFDRPAVYRIRDRSGAPLPAPRFLDLASERGEQARVVVAVLQDRLFPARLVAMLYGS